MTVVSARAGQEVGDERAGLRDPLAVAALGARNSGGAMVWAGVLAVGAGAGPEVGDWSGFSSK